jgi:hypothetical protein
MAFKIVSQFVQGINNAALGGNTTMPHGAQLYAEAKTTLKFC